ncbi:hypothetical protein [Planctomonas sp. JC2975]|uniref:hypothetical protein n=1 Tax=Planctomonas sp. JC2975 TaxID=2729626 RepID=UPI00197C2488|nr:hypothetical protein [Planctomonas sp. JC2975]
MERITWSTAWRAARAPHVLGTAVRALAWTRRRRGLRGSVGEGENVLGLPAEFLIDMDGTVLAAHYGRTVDDHWSVDEILEHVAALRPAGRN